MLTLCFSCWTAINPSAVPLIASFHVGLFYCWEVLLTFWDRRPWEGWWPRGFWPFWLWLVRDPSPICDDSGFCRFKAFSKSSNSSRLQRRDDWLLLCGSYEAFKHNIQQWAASHETCETLDDPHHRCHRHVTGWHFRSGECLWASVWF